VNKVSAKSKLTVIFSDDDDAPYNYNYLFTCNDYCYCFTGRLSHTYCNITPLLSLFTCCLHPVEWM